MISSELRVCAHLQRSKECLLFLPNYEPTHTLFPGTRWIKNIYSYILYIYIVYFFGHHKQNKNHDFISHLMMFCYTIRVLQRPFIYSLLRVKNNITIKTIWITTDRGVEIAVQDGDSHLFWICLSSLETNIQRNVIHPGNYSKICRITF